MSARPFDLRGPMRKRSVFLAVPERRVRTQIEQIVLIRASIASTVGLLR